MSIANREQDARAFRSEIRQIALLSWVPGSAIAVMYLAILFGPSGRELAVLCLGFLASAIGASLARRGPYRQMLSTVTRHLEHGASENSPVSPDATSVHHALASLPRAMQRTRLIGCVFSILLIPSMMWIAGFESWVTPQRIHSVLLISVVGSILNAGIVVLWAGRRLAPLQASVATDPGDIESGTHFGSRPTVQRKLWISIALPTLASTLILVDVVNVKLWMSAEAEATEWAQVAAESVAEGNPNLPLVERVALRLPHERVWPLPLETLELRPDRNGSRFEARELSAPFLETLDRELRVGEVSGMVLPGRGPDIGAFRRLDGGTVLVTRIMRQDLAPQLVGVNRLLLFFCFCALLVVGSFGHLSGAEVGRAITRLRLGARRLADGDLTAPIGFVSDDDLGDVTRSLERVRESAQASHAKMERAATCFEQAASTASAVMTEFVASGTEQTQQIQMAKEIMASIHGRFGQASRSADGLTHAIDESSNAVLELGAAGDELNDTASVLTAKVDDVSDSLEQMVRSVKQVAGTTDKLAAASEETSSSMEEMASAMRAVNTSAETTANLSSDVVSKAELGQAKVVQTIEGMEAIREATDIAESVIRGLGARTNEIGGILDVIDDVADETNLLALNAAIIAAQAGEHGKAFSVVADEIKELADRVLASTKEIGGLIRAVQDESENAIGAIEAGSASVMSGVDLSAEAGRTLEEITVASRESGTRIGEIVASVREQTKAASHVVALMERVRDSAEEIGAAGAEQDRGNEIVFGSAQTMREVAQQVRRTTEDQSRGFGRIRDNVEGVRDAVQQITGALGEQSGACEQVAVYVDRVFDKTRANEESVEKLREALAALVSQAEIIRGESERFRVS